MTDYEDATGHPQERSADEIKGAFKRAMFERAPLWQKMRALIRKEIEADAREKVPTDLEPVSIERAADAQRKAS